MISNQLYITDAQQLQVAKLCKCIHQNVVSDSVLENLEKLENLHEYNQIGRN